MYANIYIASLQTVPKLLVLSEAAFIAHTTFSKTERIKERKKNVREITRLSLPSVRLIFISTLNEVIDFDEARRECYTIGGPPHVISGVAGCFDVTDD